MHEPEQSGSFFIAPEIHRKVYKDNKKSDESLCIMRIYTYTQKCIIRLSNETEVTQI